MGAFLTMEGLVDAQQAGVLGRRATINHIILASPDIDIDLFRTQVGLLPQSIRERMYLLVSRDDSALRVSRRIAGGVPRVGAADAGNWKNSGSPSSTSPRSTILAQAAIPSSPARPRSSNSSGAG